VEKPEEFRRLLFSFLEENTREVSSSRDRTTHSLRISRLSWGRLETESVLLLDPTDSA
jgi:hypothetical protein